MVEHVALGNMEIALAVWLTVRTDFVNYRPLLALWITAIQYAVIRLNSSPMRDNLCDVRGIVVLVSIDSDNVSDLSSRTHAIYFRAEAK